MAVISCIRSASVAILIAAVFLLGTPPRLIADTGCHSDNHGAATGTHLKKAMKLMPAINIPSANRGCGMDHIGIQPAKTDSVPAPAIAVGAGPIADLFLASVAGIYKNPEPPPDIPIYLQLDRFLQ